jgi:hypothetical protein
LIRRFQSIREFRLCQFVGSRLQGNSRNFVEAFESTVEGRTPSAEFENCFVAALEL